ncbi:hypothetical protein HNQ50_000132 [Silvimonas terrae]|uniref:Uncharacterized protein n=1 Tax=Silvimonas terrae TaxID=300266 RepID=A0A840RAP9_9NEIS|nr:hypothetical protein [Silvimonas terrae]
MTWLVFSGELNRLGFQPAQVRHSVLLLSVQLHNELSLAGWVRLDRAPSLLHNTTCALMAPLLGVAIAFIGVLY